MHSWLYIVRIKKQIKYLFLLFISMLIHKFRQAILNLAGNRGIEPDVQEKLYQLNDPRIKECLLYNPNLKSEIKDKILHDQKVIK